MKKVIYHTDRTSSLNMDKIKESLLLENTNFISNGSVSTRMTTSENYSNKTLTTKFPKIIQILNKNIKNMSKLRSEDILSTVNNQTITSSGASQLRTYEKNNSLSTTKKSISNNSFNKLSKETRSRNKSRIRQCMCFTAAEENSFSRNQSKSQLRVLKFRDVVKSCNFEVNKINLAQSDLCEEMKSFNKNIILLKNQNKDAKYQTYLKESEENLKPNFTTKTTFIYGSMGKPKIYSENYEHILDRSKKITTMDETAAYKYREVITQKYGFKINKNFDFRQVNHKDLFKVRQDNLKNNHHKMQKIIYQMNLLKNKAFVQKKL